MKRAIDNEQKEARRRVILDSALHLFEDSEGHLSTVAAIAEKSGIAKGTIYLYFNTREEIYLALLEEFLDNWFDLIDHHLKSGPYSIDGIIEVTCGYLEDNPVFMRLASIFNGILEKNIDIESAYRFKSLLKQRVWQSGEIISKTLPPLSHELAVKLLLRSFALCIGMWQVAEPAPILKQLLREKKELGLLKIDFISETKAALQNLWQGTLSNI